MASMSDTPENRCGVELRAAIYFRGVQRPVVCDRPKGHGGEHEDHVLNGSVVSWGWE